MSTEPNKRMNRKMSEDSNEDENGSTGPMKSELDAWTNRASERDGVPGKVDVKAQWQGTTMYLPEDLREELELTYQELSLECKREYGVNMQKLRDFYPYVIELGLEEIAKRNTEDVLSDQLYLIEDSADSE